MSFSHPKSLWVLAFANLADSFSYYGTMTILVLYAMHMFNYDRNTSYLVFGIYAALIYSTPVLGGIIADKWLGSRKTLIMGGVMAVIGNLILISHYRYGFALGLSTSVIGSGFYKNNSTHLIGMLYQDGDPKKEIGFTWLYVFCNIGGTLSPLIYGYLIYKAGWSDGFLCSAIVLLISLVWFLLAQTPEFESSSLSHRVQSKWIYLACIMLCIVLSLPFYYSALITPFMLSFIASVVVFLLKMLFQYRGIEHKRIKNILIMGLFGIIYYATVMQVATTITLYIQQQINNGLINTDFPASVFSMFYSLFVLVLAPLFTWIWKLLDKKGYKLGLPQRCGLGILIAGLGIYMFALSSVSCLILSGVIIGNLLLSAGDLTMAPAIYTMISNNSPAGIKNSMIGLWFLAVAIGGYLSGELAQGSHFFAKKFITQTPVYTGEFVFIGTVAILAAIVLIMIAPRLNKALV